MSQRHPSEHFIPICIVFAGPSKRVSCGSRIRVTGSALHLYRPAQTLLSKWTVTNKLSQHAFGFFIDGKVAYVAEPWQLGNVPVTHTLAANIYCPF